MKLTVRLTAASLALALATLFVAATPGCTSTVEEDIELARLGQDCLVNSDCSEPFVCVFEACHSECESSRDCETGARCMAAARPYKVCQLEEERLCRRTSDCAEGLVCGVDGECRDKCESDDNCVRGQRCVSGTCADEDELDDEGGLAPVSGAASGSEGAPCVYVSDCSGALLCRSRACVAECKADAECGANRVCSDTRCVSDGEEVMPCRYSSQCETQTGKRCIAGGCRCMCAENRDCPSGQRCDGCGCEADPNGPQTCVYNSDCDNLSHICRDRECVCECQGDADCGEGTRCDGCGCIDVKAPLDGIVAGSVSIASAFQLPLYAGVTRIEGDLTITDGTLTSLGDTFKDLRYVGGGITVMRAPLIKELSFSSLEQASSLLLWSLTGLAELDLNGAALEYVEVRDVPRLTKLSLPGLVSGTLSVQDVGALDTLEIPNATALDSLTVVGTPKLGTLQLPQLQSIWSGFRIGKSATPPPPLTPPPPPAPSELVAPLLTTLGTKVNPALVVIQGTKLSTLRSFGTNDWQGVLSADVTIANNASLSDEEISAFRSHLLVCPWDSVAPECSQ